jgi:hypothetical protein
MPGRRRWPCRARRHRSQRAPKKASQEGDHELGHRRGHQGAQQQGSERQRPRCHGGGRAPRISVITAMDEREWLAERFEEHRTRLRAAAYRMLEDRVERSAGATDDASAVILRSDRTGDLRPVPVPVLEDPPARAVGASHDVQARVAVDSVPLPLTTRLIVGGVRRDEKAARSSRRMTRLREESLFSAGGSDPRSASAS